MIGVRSRMSIRSSIRKSLVGLDARLGIREWLRQDANGQTAQSQEQISDPFAVSEVNHPRPNTVLDIGASHGQFAREILRAFPDANIYSFEPIPECYEE